jgi:hypothetical protein
MSLDVGLMHRVELKLSTEIELSIRLRTRIRRGMTRRLAIANLVKLEELRSIDRELSEGIEFATTEHLSCCSGFRFYDFLKRE